MRLGAVLRGRPFPFEKLLDRVTDREDDEGMEMMLSEADRFDAVCDAVNVLLDKDNADAVAHKVAQLERMAYGTVDGLSAMYIKRSLALRLLVEASMANDINRKVAAQALNLGKEGR